MKDTENTLSTIGEGWSTIGEGWLCNRDRYWRYASDASHSRAFVFGLGAGLLLAIIGVKLVTPEITGNVRTPSKLIKTKRTISPPADLSRFVPGLTS